MNRTGTDGKSKQNGSIIFQVAILFLAGILITGMLTYFTEQELSSDYVTQQTENDASEVADEVMRSVKEYPAYEWLIRYWYYHADSMDIDYDDNFSAASATAEKCRTAAVDLAGIRGDLRAGNTAGGGSKALRRDLLFLADLSAGSDQAGAQH